MPELAAIEERTSDTQRAGRDWHAAEEAARALPYSRSEMLQRARISITLASLTATVPLLLLSLAVVERKWKVLLNRGPFLLEQPLPLWEKIPFVLIFAAALLVLILTASTALWWMMSRVIGPQAYRLAKFTVLAVAVGYCAALIAQYKVAQYFRDGLNMALIRGLGGGSSLTSLRYVQEEFAGLLPPIIVSFLVLLLAGWLLRRYSGALAACTARRWPVRMLASPRGLLTANVIMLLCPWLLAATAFSLNEDLKFGIAYQIYALPTAFLTDFDARDIRANIADVKSSGMGAPRVYWQQRNTPWDASRLERKNIVLLVLESGRYDLLDAKVDGAPVMPVLSSLPGDRLQMFSHAGYTVPSLNAIFNGILDQSESGISLVDRFRDLGYQTAVFSAQCEAFGDTAAHTRMDHADTFIDAASFSKEQRMYANSSASALSVPAPLITESFLRWLHGIDRKRPFFAYLNWQEMHFPYQYWGEPTPIANPPIPRGQIVQRNREWLNKTYWNSARNLDSQLAIVLAELDRAGIRSDTVIMVVGDHGEELFDHGYLGHGMSVSFEQNATIGKVINSNWKPPTRPLGLSSVSTLIHNSLVRNPGDALPLDEDFLLFVGNPVAPSQVGTVTDNGVVKFDFKRKRWSQQSALGEDFKPSPSFSPLVNLWDSFLGQLPSAAKDAK